MKKKVLIFGSDGQLGFDLTRVFGDDYEVIALNRQQAEITIGAAVSGIVEKRRNATDYTRKGPKRKTN